MEERNDAMNTFGSASQKVRARVLSTGLTDESENEPALRNTREGQWDHHM